MSTFAIYWSLLIVSGILMLGLAISGFGGRSTASRAINGIFGAGFVGYGLYLALFFTGGTYIIFFKAFIVPVLLVVRAIRGRASQPRSAPPQVPTGWPAAPPMQANPQQPHPVEPYTQQPYPRQADPQAAAQQPSNGTAASWQPLSPTGSVPPVTADDILGR